ncbi:MAG: DUF4364 family protein [Clostridia bacterium]|nr:DUF4364 family protein [Clostridia bacterium]
MADVFTAGVEPGGLTTSQEIKILLCYMLHTVGQPIGRDEVTDIITAEGMANYFDTEEAIEELLRLQHLVESEDRLLATTVTGGQIGESLSLRIPFTLRERSVKAALLLLRRRQIKKDNKVDIEKLEEGGYKVTCTVQDQGIDLLSVSLRVFDRRQAEQIQERFLEDPSLLYRSNLAVLSGDAGMRRAGTQLIIKLN